MSYPVPEKIVETEYEVKKSRFISRASFANTRDSAMSFLAEVKADYPDARHHCWAYLLGNPESPDSAAMSDDGEPAGTAGKPILNVLQHKDVGDIMVVVTRYFGGIKLGAGGLVRAYSTAAQQVITALPLRQQISRRAVTVSCSFQYEQHVRHWLNQHQALNIRADYSDLVTVQLELPEQHLTALKEFSASFGATVSIN